MKSTIIKSLFNKHIRPQLQSATWQVSNHLLYTDTNGGILKGCYFNSSGFSAGQFEVVGFVMPLYVPANFIVLSFGHNLLSPLKRQWWNYEEVRKEQLGLELAAAIHKIDKELLSKVPDAAGFYEFYRKERKISFRHFEAVAYSAVYAEGKSADEDLKDCLSFIKKKEDLSIDAVKDVYDNTIRLIDGDRKQIMHDWEAKTRAALKL